MVRSLSIALLGIMVAAGCKQKPRFEGPMSVRFGDCAGATVAWVSGPRPQPFTPAEAEGTWVAAAAPAPDDGGQATRLAIEELNRTTGDDPRHDEPDDPQLARQRAIEQARAAGILGAADVEQGGAFASLTGTSDPASGFDDTNIYGGLLGNEVGELNGGFGVDRSGFGPGGGGTGWGTIGTGRYGTIGHGAGTRGRTGSVPTVSIGQPNAQGDLDKAIIRRYIKRNLQKITYCYEKQLLVRPTLAGTVMAQFFIAPSGQVASAAASGVDRDVATCLAGVIKGIEFPRPKGGGGVQVNYPFTFRTAGEDGARPSPAPVQLASGSGSPAPPAEASSDRRVTGSERHATSAGKRPAAAPATHARALFRSPAHGPVDAARYEPGANNPLRVEQLALTECLRQGRQRAGAAVLELRYDGAGKITEATVQGLEDDDVRACVVAAAKRTPRTDAGITAQRCSFAFGAISPAAMPAIDITAGAIQLDGKPVAHLPLPPTGEPRLPELVAAITAGVQAATAATAPVLVLHPPRIVRPLPATPMNVVWQVLVSVLAGGDDLVLGAQRGASWRLLQPMQTFPLVPVPFGTGGVWNRVKTQRSSLASRLPSVDDEHVVLSLLVTRAQIWVGLSRVSEFQEIVRGPAELDKLAEALSAHKASAFFVDRIDVEIAGDGDVPYSDVVGVIDVAAKAGFTAWQLTDPPGLAARPSL